MTLPFDSPSEPNLAPRVAEIMDSIYMPFQTTPIPASDLNDTKLAEFITQQLNCEFCLRSFELWMDSVGYSDPSSQVDPSERLRLLTLCSMASSETPQWQHLFSLEKASILESQFDPHTTNPMLQRNQGIKNLINESLIGGMHPNDPSYKVFEHIMNFQGGGCGDQLTHALVEVNTCLNDYLISYQRQLVVARNERSGEFHATKGWCFWPDTLPLDFGFEETQESARQLLTELCHQYPEDKDVESVRSRLLKFNVLGDEIRYWNGVAKNHTYVLENIRDFVPDNISDLRLHDAPSDVKAVVKDLFNVDRRVVTNALIEQSELLLELYLEHSRIEPPSPERRARELAIAMAIALHIRRRKTQVETEVQGQGKRKISANQAFTKWVRATRKAESCQIDPHLRVLLCGALSLALNVEGDDGMVAFSAVEQHGRLKVQRTQFFANLPKTLLNYSAPTVLKLLKSYAELIRKNTPLNPLIINSDRNR